LVVVAWWTFIMPFSWRYNRGEVKHNHPQCKQPLNGHFPLQRWLKLRLRSTTTFNHTIVIFIYTCLVCSFGGILYVWKKCIMYIVRNRLDLRNNLSNWGQCKLLGLVYFFLLLILWIFSSLCVITTLCLWYTNQAFKEEL